VKLFGGRTERHLRLNFRAVGYSADVWLDGIHLGKHEGANTPFSLPITDSIRPDRLHTLAVRMFLRTSHTSYSPLCQPVTDDFEIPYKPVEYWSYAGIMRSVWLESVAPTLLSKVLITTADGQLDARILFENHGHADFTGNVQLDPSSESTAETMSIPRPMHSPSKQLSAQLPPAVTDATTPSTD